MANLTFDDRAGRFRDSAGRFISDARVRGVVDDVADQASERLAQASARLLSGDMSLAAWQLEAQQIIRISHVSTAVLAHGGAEQMTFIRYGRLGPVIREQYQFLADFAAQVANGAQPLNGTLTNRARQYGQASRVTYERTRGADQRQRGYQAERNVIHSGESCSVCRSESSRGWVPVGSLIPVGSRTCRSNCRCSISYRREPAEMAA